MNQPYYKIEREFISKIRQHERIMKKLVLQENYEGAGIIKSGNEFRYYILADHYLSSNKSEQVLRFYKDILSTEAILDTYLYNK
jgi:hypothetical protein